MTERVTTPFGAQSTAEEVIAGVDLTANGTEHGSDGTSQRPVLEQPGTQLARENLLIESFGDHLGKVREEDREPQPEHDLEGEAKIWRAGDEIAHEKHRRQHRHDADDEHHGITGQRFRVQFPERIAERGDDDAGIEDARFCGRTHRVLRKSDGKDFAHVCEEKPCRGGRAC